MIRYESIGELPLIQLANERLPSLNLSRQKLEQHRNTLLQKLEYMMGYITTETCREVYIRRYFGEDNITPCGHCDNCLRGDKPSPQIQQEDLRKLRSVLREGARSLEELAHQFDWSSDRTKRLLSYLIREQKVAAEADKYIWTG